MKRIASVIANGSAIKKFQDMVIRQGADPKVANELCFGDKWKCLPRAEHILTISSKKSGENHRMTSILRD